MQNSHLFCSLHLLSNISCLQDNFVLGRSAAVSGDTPTSPLVALVLFGLLFSVNEKLLAQHISGPLMVHTALAG